MRWSIVGGSKAVEGGMAQGRLLGRRQRVHREQKSRL